MMAGQNLIFAYGSLINEQSRCITAETFHSRPTFLKGYERSWDVSADSGGHTVLGLRAKDDAECNGLLFECDDFALAAFDDRESGYERVSLNKDDLYLSPGASLDAKLWTYVIPREERSQEVIAQSYLDVVLEGCMTISPDFAESFMRLTKGWERGILDDREEPLYPRALSDLQHEVEINSLLIKFIGSKSEARAD